MRSRRVTAAIVVLAAASAPAIAAAHGRHGGRHGGGHGHGHHRTLPSTIALPPGFQPEGIATRGPQFFAGSKASGQIVTGDVRTGAVRELVPAQPDAPSALGMKLDRRGRLFVSGGATGTVSVYDARSGALRSRQTPASDPAFVNDVVVLKDKAVFTDSAQQRLVVLPLGRDGSIGTATTVPITGDLAYDADPKTNEANGIVAAQDGRSVIVVDSRTGELFRIDPQTGASTAIPVSGGPLTHGDGLLRAGRTLYAVQNSDNKIAVARLARDEASATVVRTITDPDFDVPTTLAVAKRALYTVNARFSTPPAPDTPYAVVRVDGR